jgi:DNA (cytosine-5)-methyltransferase 1
MKGVSLFSSAGIGEAYLRDIGIDIILANELLEERSNLYKSLYPETEVVTGDILDDKVYSTILKKSGNKIDFLLATPPCQGMSIAGKNRTLNQMLNDERNYFIFRIIDFIKKKKPDFILIENVPFLLKLILPYQGKTYSITELLNHVFKKEYVVENSIFDSSDYGVPQKRERAIIRIYKQGKKWELPSKSKKVTVKEAIGHLPSLESGEKSNIRWHYARNHDKNQVLWLKHTPTGKSAFENKTFFPKKKDGTRIKAYMSTYRRIKWNEPAPTITIRNDAISSQRNVHPGERTKNGWYSDSRVLTPLELMILSSLPKNWKIPYDTPELLIRRCLGECIPPLLTKKIVSGIKK